MLLVPRRFTHKANRIRLVKFLVSLVFITVIVEIFLLSDREKSRPDDIQMQRQHDSKVAGVSKTNLQDSEFTQTEREKKG